MYKYLLVLRKMGKNPNHRSQIEYVSYKVHGSGEFGAILINFPKDVSILPIAESFAASLEDRLSTPVEVGAFKPSTRHLEGGSQPYGAHAVYPLEVGGRPDLGATVKCIDKMSDWVYVSVNVKGLDAMKFFEQFAVRNLKKVSETAE